MHNSTAKHPSFNHSQDIQDICNPLINLGINYFAHVNIDANNQFTALGMNPEFVSHYFEKKYYNSDIHLASENELGECIFWDDAEFGPECEELIQDAMQCGLQQTFTIVERSTDSSNFYHFSTNLKTNPINQICISNYDLLKLFIKHFIKTVKSDQNLRTAYNFKFGIDSNIASISFAQKNCENLEADFREKFLSTIASPNRESAKKNMLNINPGFSMQSSYKSYFLTKRERDCLNSLLTGKTARQTAEFLHISPRTVEHHLNAIREKTGFKYKRDLLSFYLEHNKL